MVTLRLVVPATLVLAWSTLVLAADPPPASTAPASPGPKAAAIPIYLAVQWHMHQPIYWPGEDIVQTNNVARHRSTRHAVMQSPT